MATENLKSVINEFLDPVLNLLTPEAAWRLSECRLRPEFHRRIDELANKANKGAILRLRAGALAKP